MVARPRTERTTPPPRRRTAEARLTKALATLTQPDGDNPAAPKLRLLNCVDSPTCHAIRSTAFTRRFSRPFASINPDVPASRNQGPVSRTSSGASITSHCVNTSRHSLHWSITITPRTKRPLLSLSVETASWRSRAADLK